MGTTFKYISDDILSHYLEPHPCPRCKQTGAVFTIYMDDGNGGLSSEACVNCIRTVPLRWISPKDDENRITALINQQHPKGTKSQSQRFSLAVEMCDDYRRTPRLPNFIENDDWPTCCGDFAEFIGDAGESHNGPFDGFEWWGYEHDGAIEYGIEGMIGGEDSVSLFRCFSCSKKYWTFQCT